MADATLTPQQVVRGGLEATYTDSLSTENTYQVQNDGRMILHFKKSGAGDCTATITTPSTVDGLAVADRMVTVDATTGDVFIGPFPTNQYNASGESYLEFTVSEVTDLTVAALRI